MEKVEVVPEFRVWFCLNGEVACLAKTYKTRGNATKYAKKVFGTTMAYKVAEENPYLDLGKEK